MNHYCYGYGLMLNDDNDGDNNVDDGDSTGMVRVLPEWLRVVPRQLWW